MTKDETSQQTLPGAGKKFTITGELMDFGESRTWNNQVEFKLNLKNPKLRGPESFWCPENVAEGLKDLVGQIVSLELLSDQVKFDKPADDKHWNYWCKVVGRHEGGRPSADTGAPIVQTPEQPPAPIEPAIPGFNPLPFPEVEGVVQGAMEKLATEIYLATEGVNFGEECVWSEIISDIRRLRDQLYHDLKSHRPAPPHYCYDHEKSRGKSRKTGAWGHPNTDGSWCIEGEGTTAAQAPDLSPDAFLARMEEPEQPPLLDEGGNPNDNF